jgi:rubredoxin
MVWTCTVCGYQYDESIEKEPFEKLPDDWHCPICNAPKDAFQKES